MTKYLSPLSIVFVWNPEDTNLIKPIVDYCFSLLSRDVNKPFSRSMNLPVFYRSTIKKTHPVINNASEKNIIFSFLTKEIASDEIWINYIKEIAKEEKVKVIPIAIDQVALNLSSELNNENFIRAYEYDQNFKDEYIFIAIAHEIYRYALNDNFEERSLGKNNALKIFLSHAKDGKNGIGLAKSLKNFIDNSSMQNFFDSTDIAAGYRFDDEIVGNIKNSTVIAIHSDIYSSRYWCQREILSAKQHDRPVIAVDILEEYEDRRFPFATNVPGIHVFIDNEPTEKDLLRILSSALLETIRFFYSKLLLNQYKKIGYIEEDAKISSRPPEIADIEKILAFDGNLITTKYKSIVYPEPPLYLEELTFLSKLGIKLYTPLTLGECTIKDKNVGISISELSQDELIDLGQDAKHLIQLSQDIARNFLSREAVLTYGGDLRNDGFTKFLFDEAEVLKVRTQSDKIRIRNYIAWPIHNNDTKELKEWKAKYRPIANMIEHQLPEDVKDLVDKSIIGSCLSPDTPQNMYIWCRSLTKMREDMIKECDVRIFAGGKKCGYKGKMPGVLEEIMIAIKLKKPIFLIGGFGGITSSVCEFIETNKLPKELTMDWQINNNTGYKDLLEYSELKGDGYSNDYILINEDLKMCNLNNGLSQEENIQLFNTIFIDEAIHLIIKGIKALSMK